MPYSIKKSGSNYKVVNTDTQKVKGTHDTKAEAQKQVNLLRGVERGWEPTGGRKPTKGKK